MNAASRTSVAAPAKAVNRASASRSKARKPAVLPKTDGDEGVRAYIASLEPWQAEVARRIDAMVVELVPSVRKAIRWHSPMYGVPEQGWFLAFAAFQRHVKFSFFKGTLLSPMPPSGQQRSVRSVDVRESDPFDAGRWTAWIRQAATIPGWDGGSPRLNGGTPLV